jgi:hypothetical protein
MSRWRDYEGMWLPVVDELAKSDEISKRSAIKHDLAKFMRAKERVVWSTEKCPY